MQSLVPALNGIHAYLERWLTASGLKFSGLNSKGFGYKSGFRWISPIRTIRVVPDGMTIEPKFSQVDI